jgi:hypothetical protein
VPKLQWLGFRSGITGVSGGKGFGSRPSRDGGISARDAAGTAITCWRETGAKKGDFPLQTAIIGSLELRAADFLYSVSRDFIGNCRTPMLVLPDDVPGHPLQTSIDVASLAPNAEITVFPWKEPEDLKQRTIDRVRRFLKAHVPMRAAAQ